VTPIPQAIAVVDRGTHKYSAIVVVRVEALELQSQVKIAESLGGEVQQRESADP